MEAPIPTAKEFFSTHWNLGKPIDEIMVLFAKHHRERQIEAIDDLIGEYVSKKSIENAYKEDLIK